MSSPQLRVVVNTKLKVYLKHELCVCACVYNFITKFLSMNYMDDNVVMQNKQMYVCAIFTHVWCQLYSGV